MLKKIKLNTSNKIEFIKFTSQELSAVCPVNGRPDYYDSVIEFSPKNYTLEVSSLRDYILSFRDTKILAEELTDEICSKIYDMLKPHYLSVKLSNRPENGIGIEVFQQLGWEKKL
jgi:7-cyano-7-deazaguanine reductase